jgi:PhnB protein
MPPGERSKTLSGEEGEKIMHISLPISKETMIMGSDTGGEWTSSFKQGNNFAISVNADSKEEADRIFKGLSQGGKVTMPMNNTFWGDYFGMWTDKFGINWMMSYNENYKPQ